MTRRYNSAPEGLELMGGVCVWGVTPPPKKKVKKGSGMLELRNLLNIKEYSEKLRSKKVGKRKLFLK